MNGSEIELESYTIKGMERNGNSGRVYIFVRMSVDEFGSEALHYCSQLRDIHRYFTRANATDFNSPMGKITFVYTAAVQRNHLHINLKLSVSQVLFYVALKE